MRAGKRTTIILIYVGGYNGNSYRKEIFKFNSANEDWEITSFSLPKATSSHAVTVFENIVTTTTTTTFTTTTTEGNAIIFYDFWVFGEVKNPKKVDTTNRCEALKEVYVFEMFNIKTSLYQTPPYQRAQIFQIF